MSETAWYKVDNVAKVFLATHNQRDTRTLRVSVTLNETINPEALQYALDQTIKSRSQFQMRIRRGIFWNYLEKTDHKPVVREEHERPCPILYGPYYKGVLHYSVTYYKNRINLEIFHALSDGTGAMEFLNLLTLNYLKKMHNGQLENVSFDIHSSETERNRDSYDQFYDKKDKSHREKKMEMPKKAYQIVGHKLPYNQMRFFEMHMSAKEVLRKAKERSVSLTSYLSTQLMLAIYDDMSVSKQKLPVTISMPVNLRNFYKSNTGRNFFNNISVSHVFDGTENIQELAPEFQSQMKENLLPDKIRSQMNSYSRFEHLLLARMIPLAIKQPVIRFFAKQTSKYVSAVLSSLGVQKVPEELAPFIKTYSAFCSHEGLFTTVLTYEDDLVMGFSSIFENTNVLWNFIKRLREDGIQIELFASDVV